MPSQELIAEMVDVYFQFCHMQPLWLFDRTDLGSPNQYSDDIILPLLALTLPYSSQDRFQGRTEELSRHYSKLGRDHILEQISLGNVQISTMQGLCMLAFANFIGTTNSLQILWV
jgi:hypothetical protein